MTEDKYPLWKFRKKKRHVLSVFFANNALRDGSCKRMSTSPFLKIRVTGLEMQYLFCSLHFASLKLSLQYLITTVTSLGTTTSHFLHWHATKPLWVITPQSAIRGAKTMVAIGPSLYGWWKCMWPNWSHSVGFGERMEVGNVKSSKWEHNVTILSCGHWSVKKKETCTISFECSSNIKRYVMLRKRCQQF